MEDDAVHGLWLQIVDGFAFEGEALDGHFEVKELQYDTPRCSNVIGLRVA